MSSQTHSWPDKASDTNTVTAPSEQCSQATTCNGHSIHSGAHLQAIRKILEARRKNNQNDPRARPAVPEARPSTVPSGAWRGGAEWTAGGGS